MNNAITIIKKTVEIEAPKEKVWSILFQDEFTRQWYACFSTGSHAQTDWQLGSRAVFKDDSESGIIGTITAVEPYELLTITYNGVLTNGQEDYESTGAQSMKGLQETYALAEKDGTTLLLVSCDIAEAYYDFMSAAWDKAIIKIKELAEHQL